jgi:enoyl-CoA hydratase/carnithine racemase
VSYDTLLVDIGDDFVATVTINRPEAMNAFTAQMMREFHALWPALQRDDAVRAIVLRGAPGRAFSTGADVKSAKDDPVVDFARPIEQRDPGEFLGPKSRRCWKPVVGAVHGLCCAGAFYWINECDIVIASGDAQFFDPHVSYGMIAAVEPIGLTYRIPYGEVMRMMLLGNDERMSAHTALRIGLVSEVVDGQEALWQRAHALAAKIATKPTVATQGTVRAVWESQDLPRASALVQGFKLPLIGNAIAQAGLDHAGLIRGGKTFELR